VFRDSPSRQPLYAYGGVEVPHRRGHRQSLFYEVQRSGTRWRLEGVLARRFTKSVRTVVLRGRMTVPIVKFGLFCRTLPAGDSRSWWCTLQGDPQGTYFDSQTSLHWAYVSSGGIVTTIAVIRTRTRSSRRWATETSTTATLGRAETMDTRPCFADQTEARARSYGQRGRAMAACAVAFRGENESVSVLCLNALSLSGP
jgi:hypothetical protein